LHFGPCRKNYTNILATPLGSQAVEIRGIMSLKMRNQQKMMLSTPTCHSKRQQMMSCYHKRSIMM